MITYDTILYDAFEPYIVSAWQVDGMVKRVEQPAKRANRQPRHKEWFSSLALSTALAIGAATAQATVLPPGQASLKWPTAPSVSFTKDVLLEGLRKIRDFHGDWLAEPKGPPNAASLTAAANIVPQLPNLVADARAGVDGDGNVYLRFRKDDKTMYLTVEPHLIHLLLMQPGQPNVYIDDENFKGKILPGKIRGVLATHLAS
jgi:hypothetical protein